MAKEQFIHFLKNWINRFEEYVNTEDYHTKLLLKELKEVLNREDDYRNYDPEEYDYIEYEEDK